TVPKTVTKIVLKKYLENGTKDVPRTTPKSLKLSNVGFCTINFGGYSKISFRGLKALLTINSIGRKLIIPAPARNRNKNKSPAFDLFNLFFLFDLCTSLNCDISAKGLESICLDFRSFRFCFLVISRC